MNNNAFHQMLYENQFSNQLNQQRESLFNQHFYAYTLSEFNRTITNHNPKRDRAFAIAAEVRARRAEMQVKRIES